MQEILEIVRRVTVFLLIATLLWDFFSGTEYKKYFQYVTGLIVIIMIMSPVVEMVKKGGWQKGVGWNIDIGREVEEQEEKIKELELYYGSADREDPVQKGD